MVESKSAERVAVYFGVLCDPLTRQLRGRMHATTAKTFQKYVDAINLLGIHGYLSEMEVHKARSRLLKAIAREAK